MILRNYFFYPNTSIEKTYPTHPSTGYFLEKDHLLILDFSKLEASMHVNNFS